jgi:hypothetical protein
MNVGTTIRVWGWQVATMLLAFVGGYTISQWVDGRKESVTTPPSQRDTLSLTGRTNGKGYAEYYR